jgi:hypothetical protein
MVHNFELYKTARKAFFGWVVKSFGEDDRRNMRNSILSSRDQLKEVPLDYMQRSLIPNFKNEIPLAWFKRDAPRTIEIARKRGIADEDIYELYIIGTVDYILSHIYGPSSTFSHETMTEERQTEIIWKFALGMVDSCLNVDFREKMRIKESEAIRLAVGRGEYVGDIIDRIIKSNDDAMNFDDFRKNQPSIFEVFRLGGISDDREIFRYFKIFLAHLFYELGLTSN